MHVLQPPRADPLLLSWPLGLFSRLQYVLRPASPAAWPAQTTRTKNHAEQQKKNAAGSAPRHVMRPYHFPFCCVRSVFYLLFRAINNILCVSTRLADRPHCLFDSSCNFLRRFCSSASSPGLCITPCEGQACRSLLLCAGAVALVAAVIASRRRSAAIRRLASSRIAIRTPGSCCPRLFLASAVTSAGHEVICSRNILCTVAALVSLTMISMNGPTGSSGGLLNQKGRTYRSNPD
eukprot:COSAG02_NODE_5990_length_3886_cov_2.401109_1_plen_235_part_00